MPESQTVGSERLESLYDSLDRGTTVTLKPGVACPAHSVGSRL
jgi:hypothetical protein